ncbi:MAG: hypothetical protein R2911_10515 [Caldilineaceae bacterium]
MIFDDQYICFVELKLDVRRQATQKLKDARGQLGASIEFFKTNVPILTNYRLEAYAVLQDKVYPRNSASRDIVKVRFLEQYGVELFETSTKSF